MSLTWPVIENPSLPWFQQLNFSFQPLGLVRPLSAALKSLHLSDFCSPCHLLRASVKLNRRSSLPLLPISLSRRWFGKCWYIHDLLKYEFALEFDVSVPGAGASEGRGPPCPAPRLGKGGVSRPLPAAPEGAGGSWPWLGSQHHCPPGPQAPGAEEGNTPRMLTGKGQRIAHHAGRERAGSAMGLG